MKFASDSQRKASEGTFLEFFQLCVETEDDNEEHWAFEQMHNSYTASIAGQDDRVPSFYDAMAWAAAELTS